VRCGTCAKTTPQVVAPWARPNSGFSLRMEALPVSLCQAMAVSQVAQLSGVSDGRVWRTLDHYVDQAHAQEDFSTVTSVGLDETASRRGHNYMSLFHDLDAPRGLYACEGRKAQVVAQFADALEAHGACAENIGAVCMNMSASYQAGVCGHRPWAVITFDEFHVIQLVNKAEDAEEAPAKPPQCVRFQVHQRPCRGGQFTHPGRQSQVPRLRDTRHLIPILYLVAGKLTQLPTSPFVVQSGLPITT